LSYVLGLAGNNGNDRDKCKQGAPDISCFHGIFLRLIASVRRQRRNCFFASRFDVHPGRQGERPYRMQDATRDPLK
jgi:hypothetical protein